MFGRIREVVAGGSRIPMWKRGWRDCDKMSVASVRVIEHTDRVCWGWLWLGNVCIRVASRPSSRSCDPIITVNMSNVQLGDIGDLDWNEGAPPTPTAGVSAGEGQGEGQGGDQVEGQGEDQVEGQGTGASDIDADMDDPFQLPNVGNADQGASGDVGDAPDADDDDAQDDGATPSATPAGAGGSPSEATPAGGKVKKPRKKRGEGPKHGAEGLSTAQFWAMWTDIWVMGTVVDEDVVKGLTQVAGLTMPLFEGEASCSECVQHGLDCRRLVFCAGPRKAVTRCAPCFRRNRNCTFHVSPLTKGVKTTPARDAAKEREAALKLRIIREHDIVRLLYGEFGWATAGPRGTIGHFNDKLPAQVHAEEKASQGKIIEAEKLIRRDRGALGEAVRISNAQIRDAAATTAARANAAIVSLTAVERTVETANSIIGLAPANARTALREHLKPDELVRQVAGQVSGFFSTDYGKVNADGTQPQALLMAPPQVPQPSDGGAVTGGQAVPPSGSTSRQQQTPQQSPRRSRRRDRDPSPTLELSRASSEAPDEA